MPSNQNDDAKKNDAVRKLITGGVELTGAAVGGVLGFLAGGPIGAAALGVGGSAVAMVLKRIGQEMCERLLGPREKVRVGAVLGLAIVEIKRRIENGESLRSDGFFDKNSGGRSDAEEVAESILLKCQREPEERKLPYMAHLLCNIAFHAEISAEMAHQITKAAEQLTYRQLCILKLAVVKPDFGLRDKSYRGSSVPFSTDLYQVLHECMELYNREFVSFSGDAALGLTDVVPGKMAVQTLGVDLFELMGLDAIPEQDLLPVVAQLR